MIMMDNIELFDKIKEKVTDLSRECYQIVSKTEIENADSDDDTVSPD